MKGHLREKQTDGLEEVFPMKTEEEFHSQVPSERDQRDTQEEEWSMPMSIGRRGKECSCFFSLQNENHHIELPLLLLLPLRIDFSQIGVA